MDTPSFREDHISQIPALKFLRNLGRQYLTPEEALLRPAAAVFHRQEGKEHVNTQLLAIDQWKRSAGSVDLYQNIESYGTKEH